MGIYGKENLVVNKDVVLEAAQETAKQGMSVFGIPITHIVCGSVAAICILLAISLVGYFLNKRDQSELNNYVDYKGNTDDNPLFISDMFESVYTKVRIKGPSWVKDIVKKLLNGTSSIFDAGFIANLNIDNMIKGNIDVPGDENLTNAVHQAFIDLAKAVEKSPFNQEAFDAFNTTIDLLHNLKYAKIKSMKYKNRLPEWLEIC